MKKQEIGNYYLVEEVPADVRVEEFTPDPGPGKLCFRQHRDEETS